MHILHEEENSMRTSRAEQKHGSSIREPRGPSNFYVPKTAINSFETTRDSHNNPPTTVFQFHLIFLLRVSYSE